MSSCLARLKPNGGMVNHVMEVRESDDMIHWSEPVQLTREGQLFGGHYVGLYSPDTVGSPSVLSGDGIAILLAAGNGTDLTRFDATIEKK